MIGRRNVAKWLAFSVVFTLPGGQAHAREPYRVAILSSEGERDARVVQIREGLADLGYVEGRNIRIDARFADGDPDRAAELAGSVILSHPDVIVTLGFAAWPVKRQTSSIPVVVAFSGDLVSTGLVDSMSRPGGNITGFSLMSTDLAAKRLQLLAEACAGVRQVGVLYDPDEVATVPELAETQA